MTEGMSYVKSGQVTYAVRDTVIDDKEIKKETLWESVIQAFLQ